jgi:phage shock protein C
MENKRLNRSQSDKMIGGVCGGLSEYLVIDVTIIRLIFILMALMGGHGILIYLILWLVMPPEPTTSYPSNRV